MDLKKLLTTPKTALAVLLIFVQVSNASDETLFIKSPGRAPQKGLKYRQSGVPVFEFVQKQGNELVKVKSIPRLDIGEEKEFSASSLLLNPINKVEFKPLELPKLQSPALVPMPQNLVVIPVEKAKVVKSTQKPEQVPPVPELALVADPVVNDATAQIKKLTDIKNEEYKMLQALIFLNHQKKYDLAMALFVELMEAPAFKDQAKYHYAETALGLKLYSEFRQKMIQVAREAQDKNLQKNAVEKLVQNMKYLEISDVELIDPIAKEFDIDTVNYPDYLIKKAKFAAEKGNLGEFEEAVLMIPSTSREYVEASFLKSILFYRMGQLDQAIQELEILWPTIESKKADQIRNLAALTLARLYFQKSDFKTANKYFLKVDKSSPQWLQSMIELAWAQVLSGDNEGAAGNMFTLHTEYFKKAYAPETYIVRTVGYLNLCQYGDGIHVLDDLSKKYKNVFARLNNYKNQQKDPLAYYDLVKLFLKNTQQEEVYGLPRTFIVELARHPQFMSVQKQINNYEDENVRFNKVAIDLVRKEREARLAMLQSRNNFMDAKRDGKKPEEVTALEQQSQIKAIEHFIYSRASVAIKKMREASIARLDQEENILRLKASKNLQARFTEFASTLEHLVDQKEVLSYEIYSGAGEHIRFQLAGGEIKGNDKAPASTPEEKDSYKWKFRGEVWEDEIGHYRSSLKNVCPKDDLAQGEK